ncbi:MAG: carotenoid 1,2-hydratase [Pseudomonadota bacterium]
MLGIVKPPGPPAFDLPVVRDGYRWWYLDAVSDDGRHALVIIAFVGSVFSPYYYRARQQDLGVPEHFCAINVALYGPGRRWCMTERGEARLSRGASHFQVGPSSVEWRDDRMEFMIRERSTPFGRPLRGRVRAWPSADCGLDVHLDPQARHRWTPWSPHAEVQVDLDAPNLQWRGRAYLDANAGDEPLERAFRTWDWSRTERDDGLRLHYEVRYPDAGQQLLCQHVHPDGRHVDAEPAPSQRPRVTGWGLRRGPRTGHPINRIQGLEDTPFYSRTLFKASSGAHTVHEFLDMRRFEASWVRFLLPFRMPRRKG